MISTATSFYQKRKDPKSMTVEELDEYISRNRKFGNSSLTNANSLNTSINSNNSFCNKGRLNFYYTRKNDNDKNSKNERLKSGEKNPVDTNHNYIYEYTYGNIEKTNSQKITDNSKINLFYEHSKEIKENKEVDSDSYHKALRSLQDRIHYLEKELSDQRNEYALLEKESIDQKDTFRKEIAKLKLTNSSLQENTKLINVKNEQVIAEFKEQIKKINNERNYLESSNLLLEKEKEMHLEQNALEQDDLKENIKQLTLDIDKKNKMLNETSNELVHLQNVYHQLNNDINNLKYENQELRNEISSNLSYQEAELNQIRDNHNNEKNQIVKEYNILIKRYKELEVKFITSNKIAKQEVQSRQNILGVKVKSKSKEIKNNLDTKSLSKKPITSNFNQVKIINKIINNKLTGRTNSTSKSKVKNNGKKRENIEKSIYPQGNKLKNKSVERSIATFEEKKDNYSNHLMFSNVYKSNHDSNPKCHSDQDALSNTLFDLERSNAELTRNLKNILTKINVSFNKLFIKKSISLEEQSILKQDKNMIINILENQTQKISQLKRRQKEILVSCN